MDDGWDVEGVAVTDTAGVVAAVDEDDEDAEGARGGLTAGCTTPAALDGWGACVVVLFALVLRVAAAHEAAGVTVLAARGATGCISLADFPIRQKKKEKKYF